MSSVKENKLNEWVDTKSPLDYIEDKFNNEGIEYELDWIDDGDYDVEFTIKDPNNVDRADDIICNEVGRAYEVVRDNNNNKKAFKVATYQDVIDRLNEALNKNYSLKGLTKKVVEAKETCSQDYLKYKKQLERAKSIDELRKVWQNIKKDLDDDMSFEEDKKLSDLFLDRKKELNEGLKEGWIQFTFEDGSNPYVAKTKEEQDKMFKKYKDRVEQVSDITYIVKSEKKKVNENLKEDKSVDDWLKPMFLCDTLEQQPFISFAYEDQDDSVVATTSWETTPRKAHKNYLSTCAMKVIKDNYNVNVLKLETRDGNKEFAYVMRITPKGEKVNEANDSYFSSKPNNDVKIKKFVKEYEDEIKKDIDNETYDDYGMWSHYLDMFIMDFPRNRMSISEFAIKFFDEINKRFGSDFHYWYTKEDLQEAKGKLDDALPELEKYVNEYKDKLVEYGEALAKGEVARPDYKDFTTRFIFDIYYLFKRRGLNLGKYIDENELQDKYIGTLMKKALTNCGVKITKNEYLNESLDTFNDKMDFLAKNKNEAIDGYKKVIRAVDNKNVKAHKDYLERVKENKNIKYTEPLDEE